MRRQGRLSLACSIETSEGYAKRAAMPNVTIKYSIGLTDTSEYVLNHGKQQLLVLIQTIHKIVCLSLQQLCQKQMPCIIGVAMGTRRP